MAFNKGPENPLDAKGRSILTQVAFKEAVNVATATNLPVESEEFVSLLSTLSNILTAEVETQVGKAPAVPSGGGGVGGRSYSNGGGGQRPQNGTNVSGNGQARQDRQVEFDNGFILEVKRCEGDVPSWLGEQAAAVLCTSVWDNRADAKGTRKPWFRAADGTTNAKGETMVFWPPRD